jgi:CTP:molybdopterin cytidylyltransferase MocA
VVLGSGAAAAATLLADAEPTLPGPVRTVVNPAWAAGLSTSLALGLRATAEPAVAVLVHLVDLPDVTAGVVDRVRQQAAGGPGSLARAVYQGVPGHPVLVGRDHLEPLLATLAGDRGAQAYLAGAGAVPVECGDLATGRDVDRPVED